MSLDSVSSSTSYLYQILGIDQTTSASSLSSLTQTSSESSSDSTSISKNGSFMQQLMSLQQSDPEAFKTVSQNIADDLTAEAEAETDPQRAQMLTELAAKFATAAETGEMPDLRPPQNGNGAYGPPPGDDSGGLLGELESLFSSNLASVTGSSSSSTSTYV